MEMVAPIIVSLLRESLRYPLSVYLFAVEEDFDWAAEVKEMMNKIAVATILRVAVSLR